MHSACHINIKGHPNKIHDEQKVVWSKIILLIVDEVSMMSAQMLGVASEQLKIFGDPSKLNGGIGFAGCGDFKQLPCIKATPLWASLSLETIKNHTISAECFHGCNLWQMTSIFVCLRALIIEQNLTLSGPMI